MTIRVSYPNFDPYDHQCVLQHTINELVRERRFLRDDLKIAENSIERLEEENKELSHENSINEKALAVRDGMISQLAKENKELAQQNSIKDYELEARLEIINDLIKEKNDLTDSLTFYKNSCHIQINSLTVLRQDMRVLQDKMLRMMVESSSCSQSVLKADEVRDEKALSDLYKLLINKDSEILSLKDDLAYYKEVAHDRGMALAVQSTQIKELEKKIKPLKELNKNENTYVFNKIKHS